MAFEVYTPRGEKHIKKPIITLSRSSIVFNNVARELMKASKIELAYDRESNTIRVQGSEHGIELKKTKVFGKGFYNRFDINTRGKFVAEYNEKENALYVKIG